MKKSISKILEQKICFLYKKKLVQKWPSNLQNANLVIKYAKYENTIFDLLKLVIFTNSFCLHKTVNQNNSEIFNDCVGTTIQVQEWDFYKSNLDEINYFNTLTISQWTYSQFILSALLFCIENKLHNETLLKSFVYNCSRYFAPLFLNESFLSNNVFCCLVELQLFNFFPAPASNGFIQYFTLSEIENINIVGRLKPMSKFLYIFPFFSTSFIKQCIMDCQQQQNLAPLVLALYVLYANSENLTHEKNFAYKKLDFFKKELILLKLINNEFISKCNFSYFKDKQDKIPFKKYYSSFD